MAEKIDGVGEAFDDTLHTALNTVSNLVKALTDFVGGLHTRSSSLTNVHETALREKDPSCSKVSNAAKIREHNESKNILQKAITARMFADSDNAKQPCEPVTSAIGQFSAVTNMGDSLNQQRDPGGVSQ